MPYPQKPAPHAVPTKARSRAARGQVHGRLCAQLLAYALITYTQLAMAQTPNLLLIQDGFSSELDATASAIATEAQALFGSELRMQTQAGGFDPAEISALVARALAQADASAIVVVGPLATAAAAQTPAPELHHPVVALLGLPLGAYGIRADDPRPLLGTDPLLPLADELAWLRQLKPELTAIALPLSAEVMAESPGLDPFLETQSARLGVELKALVATGPWLEPTAAHASLDAVYIGVPAAPGSDAAAEKIISTARAHQLPVLAGTSGDLVEQGALLTTVPRAAAQLRARQAMLNLEALLQGQQPQALRLAQPTPSTTEAAASSPATESVPSLPDFVRAGHLRLNVAVARSLQLEPSFALLRAAEQIRASPPRNLPLLSLEQALERAHTANLTLRAARQRLEQGKAAVAQSRAPLLPQVQLQADATWMDQDRTASPFPPAERTVTAGASLSQVLYSAKRLGDHAVQQQTQTVVEADYAHTLLSVLEQTAQRYVTLLRAQIIAAVQAQNVERTRINLALAQGRQQAGEVGREEVFRWRIALSASHQQLVAAQSARRMAASAVNEVQSFAPTKALHLVEQDGRDLKMAATDTRLPPYFATPRRLQQLQRFAIDDALTHSVELSRARAYVRSLKQARERDLHALYLPELSVQASWAQRVYNGGAGSNASGTSNPFPIPDNTDWSVGLLATFPIFEGLYKVATLDASSAAARQAEAEADALALALERQVYDAVQQAHAAFQTHELATAAAATAKEHLALVRDAYARGAADMIRLLDAQDQALDTELATHRAYHDFLAAFISLERTLGRFSFGPEGRPVDEFFQLLGQQSPTQHEPERPHALAVQNH